MKKKLPLTTFLTITILIILGFCVFSVFAFFKPLLPHLNYLLGVDKPTEYLILLGNDTEARANGGFAGSYTKITLSSPNINKHRPFSFFLFPFNFHVSFHDIYVPNGQLAGYVKPPEPIQQAFGHGTWELANADWDSDFPTSATSLRWFLEKGKETNPDILGIINLSTIQKVLHILGPISIPEKSVSLSPDNLYLYLQGQVELNFFPGSTQKADALHLVGTATLKKFYSLTIFRKLKIAKLLYQDLKNQNIVLNSTNADFQQFLVSHNFAGEYRADTYDQYGLVETNLGANKANAYVTRHTTHTITTEPTPLSFRTAKRDPESSPPRTIHQVTIIFQNTSPEANPNPPLHYGGNYLAYLRFYLPLNATNIEINHNEVATNSSSISPDILLNQKISVIPGSDPESIQISSNFTQIGLWHLTLSGNTSQVNLSYSLPYIDPKDYSLTLLKQNGFPTSPQTLTIFGQSYSTNLESKFIYSQ